MKRFFKYILLTVIGIMTLTLSGCSKQDRQQRQRRQKFQVVSLDNVSGSIGNGWHITMTVANNTVSNLYITSAYAYIRQNGQRIGKLTLDGEVILPRRRCTQVDIPVRIALANPISALGVLNRISKGKFDGITVDYSITVSVITSSRTFEGEGVSLKDLARQFNLGLKY